MTESPQPLVPAEVDLRDFQGMWIDTDRLLRSDTWVLGSGDEKAAAMTLWLESWHQVPAASLPSNDRMLAKLSQADRWPKVKEHALRGWVLCSDGRRYHPVVAEKALEAWIEKLAAAISGAAGNAKRWQVEIDTTTQRGQLRVAADLLRGLNPASRTFKKKAVAVILSGSPPESPPDIALPSPPESPPDRKGPDQTGPDQTGPDQTGPDQTGPDHLGTEVFPLPGAGLADDVPDDWKPTPAGLVCRALRAAGIGMVSPSHPRLAALLEAGATAEEFAVFADKAKDMSDPFAYVLGCVEGERKRAKRNGAEMHRGRLPSKQEAIEKRNRAAADEWLAQQGST